MPYVCISLTGLHQTVNPLKDPDHARNVRID